MQFKLEQKVHVAVTYDLAGSIAEILSARGWHKPMVICSAFQLKQELIANMVDSLDDCVIFDEPVSDPPAHVINDVAGRFTQHGCDCLIAIGGGSVIDTARGVNIVRTADGRTLKVLKK